MNSVRSTDKPRRPPLKLRVREFVGNRELKPDDEVEFKNIGRVLCQLYGYELMQRIMARRARELTAAASQSD